MFLKILSCTLCVNHSSLPQTPPVPSSNFIISFFSNYCCMYAHTIAHSLNVLLSSFDIAHMHMSSAGHLGIKILSGSSFLKETNSLSLLACQLLLSLCWPCSCSHTIDKFMGVFSMSHLQHTIRQQAFWASRSHTTFLSALLHFFPELLVWRVYHRYVSWSWALTITYSYSLHFNQL